MMSEHIKIGLDAKRIVSNATGLGSYGRTLARDLARIDNLELFLLAPDEGRNELRSQLCERDNLHYVFSHRHTSLGKALWRSVGMVRQLQRNSVDVYHGLSGELPAGLRRAGIPAVVTIHDLIFMRHPEYYNKVDVAIYTRKFHQALKRADRIVAISECTRRDICELGGISSDRVNMVYQSCAPRFSETPESRTLWQVRDRMNLPDRYVLSVGSIEERKNILLAIEALPMLPDDVSLVIVGRYTPYVEQLQQAINRERLHQRVMILHGVSDDDLPALYAMADAFVYPSRYEGFGIPIIEAIYMGLPVVACTGSCLEEAGGPDNLYVDPDDAPAMANALAQVLYGAKGREQRITRSQEYVKRFAADDAARRIADIYHELYLEYGKETLRSEEIA